MGSNKRTLVFEEDAARAIVLAAAHPAAAGRVFNVTDGEVHTVAEVTAAIAAALGRRPPRLAVPVTAARTVVACFEGMSRLLGRKPPVTRATLEKYTENIAVSGRRIQEALGFAPRWTLARGWQETITQMTRHGQL
jgi:nucleoside-diphosphate-sugar epimerase